MNATHTVRLGRASGRLVVPLSGRFAGSLCRRLLPVLLLTAQVQAQSVTIQDASFDARTLNAGSWSTTLTPWQETNGPGNGNGFVENISGFAADGANHLGMNLNHNVWQDLGVTYQANTRYTLTVAVGNRSSNLTQSSNQSRYLLADSSNTTYATGTHNASALAVGTFADAPALVFETGSSSEAIGKTIRILLEARGAGRSHFDHIRLTTAPMLLPTATTGAAGNLTDVAATLAGTVNANGAATTVSFAYGTSPSYDSMVTATPAPVTGTRNTAVTAAVSGLAPGTTYHYRVTATNSAGTTHGTDRTFTTETPAYLSALAVSEGVLSPSFAQTTTSYWVQVPPATTAIRLTAQTEDAGATIRVQGVELASGATTEPIALGEGVTQLTVGVTAAGSTFSKNYVVMVTRPMESFVFTSASSTAITAPAFDSTGLVMVPSLGYAPAPGTNLWLVNNTGLDFIKGEFTGLFHGQLVNLAYNGISYRFVANYFGGTGNDLVLEWAYGRLVGWGSNYEGTLGDGTTATRLQPVPVVADGALAGKTVVRVSLGEQHALALCSDGTLAAWGDGALGQLGNGSKQDRNVPVAVNQTGVLAGKQVIAIAAGFYHNLVLCSDGTLAAWGRNHSSQLGNGTAVDSYVPVLVDRSGVLAGKTVVAIAAGGSHCLVLCADGILAAWGSNNGGTLGNNSTTTSKVPVLVDRSGVLAGKTVTAISAGNGFNLVACSDGTAAAWGSNSYGQLGDGTKANRLVPVLVDRSSALAGRSVTAVGAQGNYDAYWGHALCADGTIAAWGSNASGQLGTGTTTGSLVPTAVAKTGALSGRTPVAAFGGSLSSYVLASDGVIAAWGYNVNGQLGNGTTTNSLVPVAVTGPGTDERFHFAAAKSHSVIARTALPPPPVVITAAASAMQDTGAKLNGSVSAQGSTTAVTFEYGLTTAYGSTATSSPANVTGSAPTAVSATLTGLAPGTIYHYRVTATSAGGRISGENQTFTTTDLARLTGMSLNEGQLSPDFAASRTAYLATVPNATAGITVTPVTADAGTTVTVNGTAVESGTASGMIALAVGHTNLSVVVTSAGGVTTRTYAITVTRLPANFTFASAGTVPVTAAGLATGGLPVTLGLGFAPIAGTTLTVVNNTATESIRGEFANLADGQRVELSYSGISYPFIVDYFGGTGNDLVLRWGNIRLLAWGRNLNGQLGNYSLNNSNIPVVVDMSGVLLGKTVSAVAAGAQSGFALTTDGRVAAWGGGVLGNNENNWSNRTAPVAVSADGALDGRRLRAFSGRQDHVLGLCTDGTVVAWGENDYGKASGNAETTNPIPTELAALGSLAGRRVIAVAAGGEHSLALCADGALGTWGHNSYGQLGNDQMSDNPVPQAAHLKGVLAGRAVVSAACGFRHTLALCADGTLAAWGSNSKGELGDGTTTDRLVPVAVNRSGVLAGKTVTAIAAGGEFSLVLCSDGTLASWGYGTYGQLGNGASNTSSLPVLVTRTGVLAGKTVTQIAAGQYHSLALCSDGTVAAWGANDTGGPLGNGSNTNSSVPVLVSASALKTGERFVSVVAGGLHSLAMVATPPPPAATTLAVSGITDISAVLHGSVTANGMATEVTFEWGPTAAYGNTSTASPASVAGTTATAVSAALTGLDTGATYHYRVVATNASGTTYGANRTFTTSQLASLADLSLGAGVLLPDFISSVTSYSATVANATDSVTVTATAELATSTLAVNGTAVASGSPSAPVSLSVGNNTLSVEVTPEGAAFSKTYTIQVIRLPLVAHFTSASTIPLTAAAFRAQGHLIGLALGHAPAVGASLTLVQNTGSRPIEGSFSNLAHGQIVKLNYGGTDYPYVANYAGGTGNDLVLEWANRRLLAWGDNSNGQLGDGTFTDRLLPVAVISNGALDGRIPLLVAASRIRPQSGGQGGSVFAMCADGALASWGINPRGLLGRGGETHVPGLVNTSGVFTDRWPAMVQVGVSHAVALCGDGVIAAWGNNKSGQIGLPADFYVSHPPTVMEMIGVLAGKTPVALAAGGSHNLVLCGDGTLAAWGENAFGQLGDGTTTSSGRAVLVSRSGVLAGKTVTAVAAGESFSLALCSDGTLASWGRGFQGVLGNGSTVDRSVPVAVTRTGVLSGKTVTRIACSAFNSLVLCSDGTLAAWGANPAGQLGNGGTTEGSSPVLVNRTGVLAGKTVTGIAAGSNHCMVSCADGAVAAWGSNYQGELGNNSTTNSSVPVLVSTAALASGERMIAAAAGHYNSYAIVAMPPAPVATTLAASAIKDTGATLNASVDGEGRSTTVAFEYGPTPSYGSTVSATPSTVTGTAPTAVAAGLTGLTPGTTYHYRVVATSTGGTTFGDDMTFTASNPPAFAGYMVTTPWQTAATIPFRKMLANASDPDGDPVTVTAAGPGTAHGATVALLADSIRYTPPNGFSGADSFTVVLTDEGGASVTGTVTVNVGQAPNAGGIGSNPPKLTVLPGGKLAISFQGIPGRTYTVQRSAGGLDDWETLANITADTAGRVSFIDESPPPGSAFYRLGVP